MPLSRLSHLAFTPALEQARLVRKGEISPLELVEFYLERIERFNPQLGCFYHVAADAALADAKTKTEQLVKTKDKSQLPPWFGIPIPIKDVNAVAEMPLTYGVAAFKEQIANYDEGFVTKIKEAGFIILGKTAVPELASLPYTESPGFAATRNPWHLDYTPGGSSGGAASALAAGLCPIAQGNDGGGSIRGPAFCCGLVGIKPARGRVSFAPIGDHQNGIAVHGCLARTVADGAALLDVMAGYIPGDPYWLPSPEISFLAATQKSLRHLKIAFITSFNPIGEATPICQQGVLKTVKLLEEMGHFVEAESMELGDLIEPFKLVWAAGIAATGIQPETLSPMNRWIAQQSGSAGEYLQAVTQIQIFARRIVSNFAGYDVVVLPTYLHPAIRLGEWADLSPEATLEKIVNWIAPCPPFNASGQPAINLPTGWDDNGLPVGVQLVGKPAAETTIISLAAQLEAAKLWSDRFPVAFA
jgi:amidase